MPKRIPRVAWKVLRFMWAQITVHRLVTRNLLILAVVLVYTIGLASLWSETSRTDKKVTLLAAARIAERKAATAASYQACLLSVPQIRNANGFVRAVNLFAQATLDNAKAAYLSTPKTDKQYATRRRNYIRLQQARPELEGFRLTDVTVADCRAGRDRSTPRRPS